MGCIGLAWFVVPLVALVALVVVGRLQTGHLLEGDAGGSQPTKRTVRTDAPPVASGLAVAGRVALSGQVERARGVFERAAAFVNDLGLLSEEVDPVSGELLGNFLQAFSHIGLVNAAWAIAQAEERRERGAGSARLSTPVTLGP